MAEPDHRARWRGPRWGLGTLAFLGLAFGMVVLSSNTGHYTGRTLLGLLVGLAGAAYCTVRGLRQVRSYRLPGNRPR